MGDDLSAIGISTKTVHWNLSVKDLVQKALDKKEGELSETKALSIKTGKYTGRSPHDRFIVDVSEVHDEIAWSSANKPIDEKYFDMLHEKVLKHLSDLDEVFVFDGYAGADRRYSQKVRVVNERASQNLFIRHLLRRQNHHHKEVDCLVLAAPGCKADPKVHGTHSEAFIILHPKKRIVIIGGTEYCGEMKKSVFSFMNYLLPKKNVLPMHCSINVGRNNDSAVFFGLSGTGKTTLSMDPDRPLIGDDEHGWSESSVFNIEGGNYAKCIHLTEEKEPMIYNAIKEGAVVENVVMKDGKFDFDDGSLTQNTRVGYPLEFVDHVDLSGHAGHPKSIIFLTLDAFGVLPPVSRLDPEQAMYHFISGYTSKVAGTERGITDPTATFSFSFGEPFMPLKTMVYVDLFKERIVKHKTKTYLINTGWTGGPFGVGKRIDLKDTRRLVTAVLNGELDNVEFRRDKIFNVDVPVTCPGVDDTILSPIDTWDDKEEYKKKALKLAEMFQKNFERFDVSESLKEAGPQTKS